MSLTLKRASAEAKSAVAKEVVSLYRRMCREVPRVVSLYDLPLTVGEVRHLVGLHFRRNASVTDPRLIEMLLTKGEMELEETVMQWKQRPHLITILQPDIPKESGVHLDGLEPVERDDFVERFIDGNLGERPSQHARTASIGYKQVWEQRDRLLQE